MSRPLWFSSRTVDKNKYWRFQHFRHFEQCSFAALTWEPNFLFLCSWLLSQDKSQVDFGPKTLGNTARISLAQPQMTTFRAYLIVRDFLEFLDFKNINWSHLFSKPFWSQKLYHQLKGSSRKNLFWVIFFLVDLLMAVHKYLSELFQQTLNHQWSLCERSF